MMKNTRFCASAPHHVTALFEPSINPSDPLASGSRGVGITVEPRLLVCEEGEKSVNSLGPTAKRVVDLLGVQEIGVKTIRPLPPAVGFAVSGATATALALALGSRLGLSLRRSLQVAHIAEVVERTGLGDVLAISCGIGLVFRFRAGAPGIGEVDCKPLPGSVSILGIVLKTMETREFLEHFFKSKAFRLARERLEAILENPTFESFIENVNLFNKESGVLKKTLGERISELVEKLSGLVTAYVKKGVLILLVERERTLEVYEELKGFGLKMYLLEPSRSGLQVWSSVRNASH
ncbi:MAG: hypothetical protein QXN05_05905 [Acidilobaceae archaeon]